MTQPAGTLSPPTPPSDSRLRQACQTLEGVFLSHLLRALRDTVPEPALLPEAPGQELFAELFDEYLADAAARHLSRGLGEALYQQLLQRADSA
jgi:flagellar protein FlgJ